MEEILPEKLKQPREDLVPATFRLPKSLVLGLDSLVKEKGYNSRTEVVIRLLRWAIEQEKVQQKRKAQKPKK